MHYARGVDFGLRRNEFEGGKLLDSLLSGKLDGTRLEKSRNWEKIKGRLNAIICLEQTLESDFIIAHFDSRRVLTGSKIQAEYVIQNTSTGEIFFIFLDKDPSQRYYCKSAFAKTNVDYLKNQIHRRNMGTTVSPSKLHTGACGNRIIVYSVAELVSWNSSPMGANR